MTPRCPFCRTQYYPVKEQYLTECSALTAAAAPTGMTAVLETVEVAIMYYYSVGGGPRKTGSYLCLLAAVLVATVDVMLVVVKMVAMNAFDVTV